MALPARRFLCRIGAAHQGSEAATEFQKIADHRGVVLNESIGALATFKSAEPVPYRARPRRLGRFIRISLQSGKTPTLVFPSSSSQKPNTRSCSSYW